MCVCSEPHNLPFFTGSDSRFSTLHADTQLPFLKKKKKKGPKKPPVKFQSLCHICIPITPPFPHGQQAISTMKLKQIYMQEIRNIAMMVSRFCQQSLKRENGRFWSDILYVYISSPNYKLTYHTWDPEDTKLEKDPCGTY